MFYVLSKLEPSRCRSTVFSPPSFCACVPVSAINSKTPLGYGRCIIFLYHKLFISTIYVFIHSCILGSLPNQMFIRFHTIYNNNHLTLRHDMETLTPSLTICEGNPPFTDRFPPKRASYAELQRFFDDAEQAVGQTNGLPVVLNTVHLYLHRRGCYSRLHRFWQFFRLELFT